MDGSALHSVFAWLIPLIVSLCVTVAGVAIGFGYNKRKIDEHEKEINEMKAKSIIESKCDDCKSNIMLKVEDNQKLVMLEITHVKETLAKFEIATEKQFDNLGRLISNINREGRQP